MAEKTVSEAITETALGPARVEVDGMVVQPQKVQDQILADQYTKREAARSSTGLPIRFGIIRPRGTV